MFVRIDALRDLDNIAPPGNALRPVIDLALLQARVELADFSGRPPGAEMLPGAPLWGYCTAWLWLYYTVERVGGFWRRLIFGNHIRITILSFRYDPPGART
jgi:hypothetical protein